MTKGQRGINSIEVGGKLLLALSRASSPLPLKDLAREASMSPAKAHPYLVSFQKLGLIEQDAMTGRYDLGHEALRLGLAAIQRVDAIRVASEELARMSLDERHSTAIALWGNQGPTIVRFEEADYPLHVYLRNGTVLSLANTATGLLFAAYMPEKVVREALKTDKHRFAGTSAAAKLTDMADAMAEVRKHGLARNIGVVVPGVNSISAPVFNHQNQIELGVAIMSPGPASDAAWDGKMARMIAECGRRISMRLGHQP